MILILIQFQDSGRIDNALTGTGMEDPQNLHEIFPTLTCYFGFLLLSIQVNFNDYLVKWTLLNTHFENFP